MSDVAMLCLRIDLHRLFGGRDFRGTTAAVFTAHLVLQDASRTWIFHLSGRHGDEKTIWPLDHFNIANYKGIIKSYRRVGLELFILTFFQKHPNLRHFHDLSPSLRILPKIH